jgi:pSer/pThr/pTyr-binding forkhead associated (FHA) protein
MSEQLLTILKLCLLALLYLFFFRVLRAVWAELRAPVPAPTPAAAAGSRPAPAPAPAPSPAASSPSKRSAPGELVVVAPATQAGRSYPIGEELTVGRAGGCAVSLPEDTYVSTLHARVFRSPEGAVKVEDLGSTNGTFVNKAKVGNAVVLQRGDRLQVGNTTLEAR